MIRAICEGNDYNLHWPLIPSGVQLKANYNLWESYSRGLDLFFITTLIKVSSNTSSEHEDHGFDEMSTCYDTKNE